MAGEELLPRLWARVASDKIKKHISVTHDKAEKICTECKKVCIGQKSYYTHMRNHGQLY